MSLVSSLYSRCAYQRLPSPDRGHWWGHFSLKPPARQCTVLQSWKGACRRLRLMLRCLLKLLLDSDTVYLPKPLPIKEAVAEMTVCEHNVVSFSMNHKPDCGLAEGLLVESDTAMKTASIYFLFCFLSPCNSCLLQRWMVTVWGLAHHEAGRYF